MKERIAAIIEEMRLVAKDDSQSGHYWSQTTGDTVGVEVVERWAKQIEEALNV